MYKGINMAGSRMTPNLWQDIVTGAAVAGPERATIAIALIALIQVYTFVANKQ